MAAVLFGPTYSNISQGRAGPGMDSMRNSNRFSRISGRF